MALSWLVDDTCHLPFRAGPSSRVGGRGALELKLDSRGLEDSGSLRPGALPRLCDQSGAERLEAFRSAAAGGAFRPRAIPISQRSPCLSSRISSMPSRATAQQELRPPLIPS